MKLAIVIAILVTCFLVAVCIITRDHWWVSVSSAKVAYNDADSPNARVYRSRDGNLLINLESNGDSLYEVHYFARGGKWLVGNTSRFHFLPGLALSENVPPATVDMDGVKIETDPKLVVNANGLEFTTTKLARVRVDW